MTPSTTQDEVDVWQLTTRYATALDMRDWAALAQLFAEDGVMDFAGLGEVAGPSEIAEVCSRALTVLDASQHLVGTHVVEVAGDEARSRCYFQAQHVRHGLAEGDSYVVAGAYVDLARRGSAGWQIQHRKQTVSWTSGNPGVLAHF